jgi:hypothetical protein
VVRALTGLRLAEEQARLAGVISAKDGLKKFLKVTPSGLPGKLRAH